MEEIIMNASTASNASTGGLGFISAVFIIYFLVTVIWQLFRGWKRGLFRQALHTGLTLLSAIIAFSVASSIGNELLSTLADTSTAELIAAIESASGPLPANVTGIISSIDLKLIDYLLMMPATTLIAPFLFTTIFLLLNWLFRIAYFILHKLLPHGANLVFRLSGLGVGLIEGMLIAGCVLLPIVSITTIADDVMATVEESELAESEGVQEILDIYEQDFAPVTNNMAFGIVKTFGGKAALNNMATVKDGDIKMNMRDEMITTVRIALIASTSFEGADMKAPNDTAKAGINAMLDELDDSYYLTTIVAGTLSGMARAVDGGHLNFELDSTYASLLNSAISVLKSTTVKTLDDDLDTIKNVYFILGDNEVLAALTAEDADVSAILTQKNENGDTVINQVIDTINKNAHMSPLVTALTKLSLSVICETISVGENSDEIYDNLKGGLNTTLTEVKKDDYATEEEYREALSESINVTLIENDINLEPEIVSGIADHVAENYGDVDSLSDEEFNDVMLSYYDAYLKYQETGEIPEGIVE